jgi:hypothetical protein
MASLNILHHDCNSFQGSSLINNVRSAGTEPKTLDVSGAADGTGFVNLIRAYDFAQPSTLLPTPAAI